MAILRPGVLGPHAVLHVGEEHGPEAAPALTHLLQTVVESVAEKTLKSNNVTHSLAQVSLPKLFPFTRLTFTEE